MRVLAVSLLLLASIVAFACTSETSADAPFGCCEISDTPPACVLKYGRAKQSANDDCIDGHDGLVPDPNQSGWTKITLANGCPAWKPPENPTRICCGCARLEDASTDAATEGGTDAQSDAAAD